MWSKRKNNINLLFFYLEKLLLLNFCAISVSYTHLTLPTIYAV